MKSIKKYCLLFFISWMKTVVAYPIDVVYTWVNGNDPEWQMIKDSYLKTQCETPVMSKLERFTLHDSTSDNRFADNEELRYSLRSIAAYAPFVNHIYIVTMNQKPSWLVTHPKITIVDHTEIFKDTDNLPTFNSHAIESNLHRIPGLSEHFIYFNDDVFLGAPVEQNDFFVGESVNVLFTEGLSPRGSALARESAFRRAWRNTNQFLDTVWGEEPRYRLCHAPAALRKSYMTQFDEHYPFIFENNSKHKFRSDEDFNVTNGLLQYHWLHQERVVSHPLSTLMLSLYGDHKLEKALNHFKRLAELRPHFFCIQNLIGNTSSDKTKELLHLFLENYFPHKAEWEE